MDAFYEGRLQSKAKHEILGSHLERLAYKVFSWASSMDYVDGFSGPWENSDTEYFSDTSFSIAIRTLKQVQQGIFEKLGRRVRVRCVFVEKERDAFEKLCYATAGHQASDGSFEIRTVQGSFEEVADRVAAQCDYQFRMVFIDPTGWTGFDLDRLPTLLRRKNTEVMFNFMHRFIGRFINPEDRSFDGLLGADWRQELLGPPYSVEDAERLFRRRVRDVLGFTYVAGTPVFETAKDSILFKLVFGTLHPEGLKVFRDVSNRGLKEYDDTRRRTKAGNQIDLLDHFGLDVPTTGPFSQLVMSDQASLDSRIEREITQRGPLEFGRLWPPILEDLHVTWSDVRKAVAAAEKARLVSWKPPGCTKRLPAEDHVVRLLAT